MIRSSKAPPLAALALGLALAAAPAAAGDDYLPGPDAGELWQYISAISPYTSWQPFPTDPELGSPPLAMIEEPHGAWVAIYVNPAAYESMFDPLTPFSMRYGSILVKENYPKSDTPPAKDQLLSLTVMYKVRGYRSIPTEDEWFWVMFTPTGRVVQLSDQPFLQQPDFADLQGEVQAGKPWFCLSCHIGARDTSKKAVGDYVWKLKPFQGTKP